MTKKSLTILSATFLLFFAANYALAQKAKPIKPKSTTNSVSKTIQNDSQKDFFGEIEDNSYKNKFFNVKITLPETWLVQESEVGKAIKKAGEDAIKGKTTQIQNAFDEATQRVSVLFTASKDILGIENNAIMIFAAEKNTPLMQLRNGEDYLRLNIQTFQKMQMPPDFKYSEKIESEKIGSETFYYIDVERAAYKQRLYATYRTGYALFFTLSYTTNEDLEKMRSILKNSDFAWKE